MTPRVFYFSSQRPHEQTIDYLQVSAHALRYAGARTAINTDYTIQQVRPTLRRQQSNKIAENFWERRQTGGHSCSGVAQTTRKIGAPRLGFRSEHRHSTRKIEK